MLGASKVGLITLYENNYGSMLQAYSTKSYLESLGVVCEVLSFEENNNFLNVGVLKRKLKTLLKLLSNPYFTYFVLTNKIKKNPLSSKTQRMMNRYVNDFIHPQKVTLTMLEDNLWLQNYIKFIVGSDQIWNVEHMVSPFRFLKFAPRNKRIALATSFGPQIVSKNNRKEFSEALDGFDLISVREESSLGFVKEYTSNRVIRIPDPTLIYSKYEWLKICEEKNDCQKKYIFVHFLNNPNKIALDSIMWLSEKLNLVVVAVGYNYSEYSNMKNFVFLDCAPQKYVSLIANAEFIMTDSFHSTLFSINFEKKFFSFYRQYQYKSQSSRIVDLLNRFDLANRLIENKNSVEKMYLNELPCRVKTVLEQERSSVRTFLQNAVVKI